MNRIGVQSLWDEAGGIARDVTGPMATRWQPVRQAMDYRSVGPWGKWGWLASDNPNEGFIGATFVGGWGCETVGGHLLVCRELRIKCGFAATIVVVERSQARINAEWIQTSKGKHFHEHDDLSHFVRSIGIGGHVHEQADGWNLGAVADSQGI